MKNVEGMSLEQKMMELQQSVSKARVGAENTGSADYEFLINSNLGDSRDEKLAYYSSLITKAQEFRSGKFDNLDYDVRNQMITELNNKIDEALLSFPGYEKEVQQGLGR